MHNLFVVQEQDDRTGGLWPYGERMGVLFFCQRGCGERMRVLFFFVNVGVAFSIRLMLLRACVVRALKDEI
jgi:hypothetical protein